MQKPKSCLWKWTKRLFKVIAGFYLFLYLFSKAQPWLPYIGYTKSMEIVEVVISSGDTERRDAWTGGTIGVFVPDPEGVGKHIKLRIPESYLNLSRRDGGIVQSTKLEATYPDFKPWGAEYLKAPFSIDEHSGKIDIKIALSDYIYSMFEYEDKERYLGEYQDTIYGLERYKEKPVFKDDGTQIEGLDLEYFFSLPNIEPPVRFRCPRLDVLPNVRCRAATNLNDDIYIEYTFLRRNLANWPEIDGKVRDFVSTLIAKDN